MKHLYESKMFSHLIQSYEWDVKTISCDSNRHTQRERIWHFPTVKEKCLVAMIARGMCWGLWPRVHSRLSNADFKIENPAVPTLWIMILYSIWLIDLAQSSSMDLSRKKNFFLKFWKLRKIQILIYFCLVLGNVKEICTQHLKATATAAWLPGEEFTWMERENTSFK